MNCSWPWKGVLSASPDSCGSECQTPSPKESKNVLGLTPVDLFHGGCDRSWTWLVIAVRCCNRFNAGRKKASKVCRYTLVQIQIFDLAGSFYQN